MFVGPQDRDPDTAFIILPLSKKTPPARDIPEIQEEAEGLARAIRLDVVASHILNYSSINAGHFFGKGTRESLAQEIADKKPSIVIVNHALSPVQQRNLEKEWDAKIIDRTGLILEIFGDRAQTKEGRLQVELAALDYQKSRLVRSWTHLERQRGGAGFMGGPGERQIELDRRMISQRMTRLKKDLESVRRTRELGRQSRERVPFPVVSLVGYTNAGKSTLFNRITQAGVFAEDLPFATLDPTLRKIDIPGNQKVILSDTVGFIADLPTHLIAAFRATLEHILYANVIVHVIDMSRKDYMAQKQDVIEILKDLGIHYEQDERIIEVYNKIDMLGHEEREDFIRLSKTARVKTILISANSGEGVDTLLEEVSNCTAKDHKTAKYEIKLSDGRAIAWLYEHSDVFERKDGSETTLIQTRIKEKDIMKFKKDFNYISL